jgi:hypothetical protein
MGNGIIVSRSVGRVRDYQKLKLKAASHLELTLWYNSEIKNGISFDNLLNFYGCT